MVLPASALPPNPPARLLLAKKTRRRPVRWQQLGGEHCTACQELPASNNQRPQSLTDLRRLSERLPCLARPCQWLTVQWWIISSTMRNFISLFTILHLATSKHKGELPPMICRQIELFGKCWNQKKRNFAAISIWVFSDPIERLWQSANPKPCNSESFPHLTRHPSVSTRWQNPAPKRA